LKHTALDRLQVRLNVILFLINSHLIDTVPNNEPLLKIIYVHLFCSLAVLDPRVGIYSA